MNINDFTQFFDNPAVSVFNRSKSVSTPIRIGPLYPLKWDLLSFGNSQKSHSAHSMRLAPLVAPTFTNLRLDEHSAVVPLRSIIDDYEDRFNFGVNKEGAALPVFHVGDLSHIYKAMLKVGISPIGSLFDYLGYPVYADLYKSLNFDDAQFTFSSGGASNSVSVFTSNTYAAFINSYGAGSGRYPTVFDFSYRKEDYQVVNFMPFTAFLASRTFLLDYAVPEDLRRFYVRIPGAVNPDGSISSTFIPSLDELIEASSFSTTLEATNAYKLYLFGLCLTEYFKFSWSDDAEFVHYSSLPLRAYFRFVYDWLVNGNFINKDLMLERRVFNLEQELFEVAGRVLDGDLKGDTFQGYKLLSEFVLPVNRLWRDDFFTSLLPSASIDNAVEIPANSTVLDLAKLTAWQKFVMKLSYSSRYRDVIWNIFKIKPSNSTLIQSYPIFRKHNTVGIGEVNQTSSSDVSSVLGSFAGRGYSSGRSKGYHIFCEEPCIVFDFISLIPSAVYADALHPLIHVDDILDFPLPDMDVLGNQPISTDLLTGHPHDHEENFGFGRQYQEWLLNINTVHGEFKTDLDYWVLSRRFDGVAMNDDFLRINDADDLSNIFSVPLASHAFLDVYYNSYVSRHVHRNVRIKI